MARGGQWRLGRCGYWVAIAALAMLTMGVECSVSTSPPPERLPPIGGVDPPLLSVTLNGVEDSLNDILVVPPSGFVLNAAWQAVDTPVLPLTLSVVIYAFDGIGVDVTGLLKFVVQDGAVGLFTGLPHLPMGSYQIEARIRDQDGSEAITQLDFAVREHTPPIGTGQIIWLDFESDRDATPGPDFDVDLEVFGFASPSAPGLKAPMRERVITAVLDRVSEVYFDSNPNGFAAGDAIRISLITDRFSLPSTTQICVGGSAGIFGFVGSILLDPGNLDRQSVECSSLPPTGIFPSGLLAFSNSPGFQQYIDPLRSAGGGTPVGANPLDAVILDAAFDPAMATADELTRLAVIEDAVSVFGDVLGTIIAHEVAHALGLVPPAAPGAGLYGGQSGPEFTHNVMADGSTPSQNFVMNAGNTTSFESLGGLSGYPLPSFRPLNHAYLRDRAVIDPKVTAILPAPQITGVTPTVVQSSLQTLTITGSGFADTPAVRLTNATWVHQAFAETLVSNTEMRATVSQSSLYPGTYDVELTNPDGQWVVLPSVIVVP